MGVVLLYAMKAQEIAHLSRAVQAREEEYARYSWLDRDIQETRKRKDELLARIASARGQVQSGLPAREILGALPHALPSGVRLVQFTLAGDGKTVMEGEATSLEAVASFMLSLEDTRMFENARLASVTRISERAGLFVFHAMATLSGAGGGTP
jgi:Tfp pilus assembly protein PilN